MKKERTLPTSIIVLIILFGTLVFTKPPFLFYINSTPSAPAGVYVVASGRPTVGDWCVIESNHVPIRIPGLPDRLLKRVAYTKADSVVIDEEGLHIDDVLVWKRTKKPGPELLYFRGYIRPGACLLLNDHDDSYDSRVFGPVSMDYLTKVALLIPFERKEKI